MTYNEKIVKATCLFCGAPLTSNTHCNYCGCNYLKRKEFELLNDDITTIETTEITINKSSFYSEFSFICNYKYHEMLKGWFNLVSDSLGKPKSTYTKTLCLKQKESSLIVENSFIITINISEITKDSDAILNITIGFDKFYMKF